MTVSFEQIKIGTEYSRKELAKLWGYKSYEALSRGIITPSKTPYIVIFITKNKQSSLHQYEDGFQDNILEMEGETTHAADSQIVNAENNDDEIYLFYRDRHHTPFTYYGRMYLIYSKIHDNKPSRLKFVLNKEYFIAENSLETEKTTHGDVDDFIPDEEGRKKIHQHVSYERSGKNRRKAIEIHGTKCKACGFDFNEFYKPDIARSYIEIHHTQSITKQEGKPINPAQDLIPLCSNCHHMAHRQRNKILSADEIRSIIIHNSKKDIPTISPPIP